MDGITTVTADVVVTRATREDVADIAALLRDDVIGAGREGTDLTPDLAAFDAVDADPQQLSRSCATSRTCRSARCS
ncbi:hypothetical protein DUHN55_22060 [Helicobacter pylori]